MYNENKVQQGSQNIELLATLQFSSTEYKICNDEEILTFTLSLALICDDTQILGKCNFTTPFQKIGAPSQTGIFECLPRICIIEYTPVPERH